jgi:glycerol-3-phosphate dehydrogenase
MAERVVDEVVSRLGARVRDCSTARVPLVEDGPAIPGIRTRITDEEVAYAIDHECSLCVADVLERRARISLFARGNGLGDADRVAGLLAGRLGWSSERQASEIADYRARIAEDVAWREETS